MTIDIHNRLTHLTVAAVCAGVLLVGTLFLVWRRDQPPRTAPAPTPAPHVVVEAGRIRTIPTAAAGAAVSVAGDLGTILSELYERAFLPPIPAPTPRAEDPSSPAPTPIARPPVRELFTLRAGEAVDRSRDAFTAGDGARIERGTVRFSGLVTMDAPRGTSALLDVVFVGHGSLRSSPLYRLEQRGQLLLVRGPGGWRVAGFDVRLTAERGRLPATPDGEASAVRWMP